MRILSFFCFGFHLYFFYGFHLFTHTHKTTTKHFYSITFYYYYVSTRRSQAGVGMYEREKNHTKSLNALCELRLYIFIYGFAALMPIRSLSDRDRTACFFLFLAVEVFFGWFDSFYGQYVNLIRHECAVQLDAVTFNCTVWSSREDCGINVPGKRLP